MLLSGFLSPVLSCPHREQLQWYSGLVKVLNWKTDKGCHKYTYTFSLLFFCWKWVFIFRCWESGTVWKKIPYSLFIYFFFQKEASLLYCSVCYKVKYFHSKLGLLHVQLLKCYRIFAHCTAIFLFKFGTLVWSLNCYNFRRFYSAVCFLRAVFNSCSEVPVSYL